MIKKKLKKLAVVTKKEVAVGIMTDDKETVTQMEVDVISDDKETGGGDEERGAGRRHDMMTQVEVDVIGDDDETGGDEGARAGNGRRTP